MARAPKPTSGKKLKTELVHVPQPDLTEVATLFDVYFQPDNSCHFAIRLPDHIAATLKHADHVTNASYNGVVGDLRREFDRYRQLLRQDAKKRVILVFFGAQCVENVPGARRLHNAGNDAIQFRYDVLWQVGDKLYSQYDVDSDLKLVGDVRSKFPSENEGRYVLDWTAEREVFFEAMAGGMLTLIRRLSDFFVTLSADPDKALASIVSARLLLGVR